MAERLTDSAPADTGVITKSPDESVIALCTIFVPVFVAFTIAWGTEAPWTSVMRPTKRPDSTWPLVEEAAPRKRTRIIRFWILITSLRAFILVPQLLNFAVTDFW